MTEVLTGPLDVGRGDRVAFLGFNSPEMIAILFACARIGAIVVPLNWRLRHGYNKCDQEKENDVGDGSMM